MDSEFFTIFILFQPFLQISCFRVFESPHKHPEKPIWLHRRRFLFALLLRPFLAFGLLPMSMLFGNRVAYEEKF